jgi:hypothetical protein
MHNRIWPHGLDINPCCNGLKPFDAFFQVSDLDARGGGWHWGVGSPTNHVQFCMFQSDPVTPATQSERGYYSNGQNRERADNDVEVGILLHGSFLSLCRPLPAAQFFNLTVKIMGTVIVGRDAFENLDPVLQGAYFVLHLLRIGVVQKPMGFCTQEIFVLDNAVLCFLLCLDNLANCDNEDNRNDHFKWAHVFFLFSQRKLSSFL